MQKFNDISDKNPFRVPEKYFEEVNRKIISATSGHTREIEKRGFYDRFRPYLLTAASVTGFIILGYSAVKLLSHDRLTSLVSDVNNNDPNELYINDIDILSLEENAALLGLSDEGADINKSDIINYLLLENIEINEIYEQL
jgi:hypothetical protein